MSITGLVRLGLLPLLFPLSSLPHPNKENTISALNISRFICSGISAQKYGFNVKNLFFVSLFKEIPSRMGFFVFYGKPAGNAARLPNDQL
jgi:hypothetical protein